MMKGLFKWEIIAIFLIFCVPAVSAFTISSYTQDPTGSLLPSTPVTVSFKIDNSGQFPSADDLMLYTDLEKPTWTYTIIVNGVENLRPVQGGKTLDITGFELNYKTTDEVSVRITLEGTTPSVTTTGDKVIVRVTENDANGNAITSTQVTKTATIVNTGEVQAAIAARQTDLQTFRANIDEKAAIGIDTSAAEAQDNEASQDISMAQAQPSTAYATALDNLNAALTAIQDGGKALDKAWAENDVAAAQVPITNVDAIIAWFKGNQSTSNDVQLPAIVAKRELAVGYISNANDAINSGNYDQARSKAQDAFAKGNESYTDALARQYEVTHGGIDIGGMIGGVFSSGVLVIGAVIVLVVLVVVGVVIYRKRSRWDELG